MDHNRLNGLRVAILVSDGFEQVEMTEPRKALEQAGAETTIVSPASGSVQGFNHFDKADSFPVDMELKEANPDDFDAVLLPGGANNADYLRVMPEAQEFIKKIDAAHKPIAVICHAPWLLVSAGLVRGKTLTSYHTIQDDIKNAGATWIDQELVHDGNWVSSRSPKDLPVFNKAMVELFAEFAGSRMHGDYETTSTQQSTTII